MPNRRRLRRNDNGSDGILGALFLMFIVYLFFMEKEISTELTEQPFQEPFPPLSVIWLTEENRDYLKPALQSVEFTQLCYPKSLKNYNSPLTMMPVFDMSFNSTEFELYDGNDENEVLANFQSKNLSETMTYDSDLKERTLNISVKDKICVGISTQTEYRVKLNFVTDRFMSYSILLIFLIVLILAPLYVIFVFLFLPFIKIVLWIFSAISLAKSFAVMYPRIFSMVIFPVLLYGVSSVIFMLV